MASRATRCSKACEGLSETVTQMRELAADIQTAIAESEEQVCMTKIDEFRKRAADISVDYTEIEELASEMGSWRDNVQGTNLENTSRSQTVSETADALESVDQTEIPALPEADINEAWTEFADELESAADEIENTVSDIESLEFPGMYS